MALITCKDCQKEFSTDAKNCPHCGANKPKAVANKAVIDTSVVICKKCKKEFNRSEKKCPYCGAKKPVSLGMKIIIGFAVLFFIGLFGSKPDAQKSQPAQITPAQAEQNEFPYKAIFTCGMTGSQHINIAPCFINGNTKTQLELNNGADYGLYQIFNFKSIGAEYGNGFHIRLHNSFAIKAQNASDTLILGLIILDSKTGEIVFQKQVAHFGVIAVQNGNK